jgi:hypothetical protein
MRLPNAAVCCQARSPGWAKGDDRQARRAERPEGHVRLVP